MQIDPTDERLSLASEDFANTANPDSVMVELSAIRRQLTAQAEEINHLKGQARDD